jgi:hypothetical protein
MRLIMVPQYPSTLRYQEWWFEDVPREYGKYYDEVIVLGEDKVASATIVGGNFAPIDASIRFELDIIDEYLSYDIRKDDVLLLNDLSFPGIFTNVLYHRRPEKCFAICHATSKNNYDYFAEVRASKYLNEVACSKLFSGIFVGSSYHAKKLGWSNLHIVGLPLTPLMGAVAVKCRDIVSVARSGIQKRNACVEDRLSKDLSIVIERPNVSSWAEYYQFLAESRILLITSKEETFGYQVVDAIVNNCIPVAPNKYSYPELLDSKYLYNSYYELVNIIKSVDTVPKLKNWDMCNDFFYNTYMIMGGS